MEHRIPELGRFTEPALLILVSLSDGPKHGYAIMTDVEAAAGRPSRSRGRCMPRSPVSKSAVSSRRLRRSTGAGRIGSQPSAPRSSPSSCAISRGLLANSGFFRRLGRPTG